MIRTNFKETRLMLGLSQEALARHAEVSRETIRAIENGGDCRVSIAIRLADLLGPSVEYLFGKEEPEQ